MYGKDRNNTGRAVMVDESGQLLSGLANAAIEGRLFHCNTATTVECSTTLNTTFTGLAVSNPATSGKYFVFYEFGFGTKDAIGAEGLIQLALTTSSGIAGQLTAQPSMKGSGGSSASLCDEAATIIAPVVCKTVGNLTQGADSVTYGQQLGIVDLKGSIVLAPGQAIVTNLTVAPGNSMSFHFQWEEVSM